MKTKYFLMAAAATTLAACSINDSYDPTTAADADVINLSATIDGGLTRAALTDAEAQNTQFEYDAENPQSIHVEAWKHADDPGAAPDAPYTNGDYTLTNAAGGLTGSLKYPADRSKIDIVAYYPASINYGETSFSVGNNQTDKGKYQACDLMKSVNITNVDKDGGTHGLTFTHQMSRIVVVITPKDASVTNDDINDNVTDIKINGTKLGATIAKGVVTAATGDATPIDITGATSKLVSCGIIVPTQTIASGTKLITFKYGTLDVEYELTEDLTPVASQQYTYTFNVGAEGISLESTSIENWTNHDQSKDVTL